MIHYKTIKPISINYIKNQLVTFLITKQRNKKHMKQASINDLLIDKH